MKVFSTNIEGATVIGRIELQMLTKTLELGSVIINEPNVYTSDMCPQINACGN